MTIHKLTAGDGYTYLTRDIAHGDVRVSAADYYTLEGNPPGRWIGRGAHLLGVAGQPVTEEQMRALYGHGQHPAAAQVTAAYLAANLQPGLTSAQAQTVVADTQRAATLGRAFPTYAPLAPFEDRVRRRIDALAEEVGRTPTGAEIAQIRGQEAHRQRAAVAGFDIVFSPVKSAALLWGLDPRDDVRRAVRDAHEQAKGAALALLEEHAALTRAGTGGVAQIDTHGLIAASFDHYDSREGDPNLHTHVVVSSKVQGTDGVWRALDARALYQMTVAASETYNTVFQAALSERLGVSWTARSTRRNRAPVHEIAGIPGTFLTHFSRRRVALEDRYEQLVRAYRTTHGHDPSMAVCHQLARQANLDTRQPKRTPRSLATMRDTWTRQLREAFGPDALGQLMAAVPAATSMRAGSDATATPDAEALATAVVAAVGEQRSTWTVWHLRAEAQRQLRGAGLIATVAAHQRLVEDVLTAAAGPRHSILVEAPAITDEPAALRRANGESVFVAHAAARYTSTAVLDAEQRLVDAARTQTPWAVPELVVEAALADFEHHEGRLLDAGQRELVTAFTRGPLLAAGLGAAGTGKTTAMRAVHHAVQATGQRLIPLATSAASAAVLGGELGVRAENVHKFLYEHAEGRYREQLREGAPVPASHALFALRPGDVLLVDEAGMAGTHQLDRLLSIAQAHGALVRLLGDYRQLGAVESGGVLRLIATNVGAAELTMLHRFANPAEAAATLQLRDGDAAGLDFYAQESRIHGGSHLAMLDDAYAGWHADMAAGRITLMVAATNADVTALGAQARADRVALGLVEHDGVELADGNRAGRGDWIVTRQNERRASLNGGRDWVRNGDGWRVLRRHRDGSLTVRHLGHSGRVRLPAAYVSENVELLYAATVHRAQGSTVDTAHVLVGDEMAREHLYVALTRARLASHLYVGTHETLPLDEHDRLDRSRHDPRARAAREVLHAVLGRQAAELSATETICVNQETAGSLSTLMPRLIHATERAADTALRRLATTMLDPALARQLLADPAWLAVVGAVQAAQSLGWQPAQLLAAAISMRDFRGAESVAEVLAWRIGAISADRTPGAPLGRPTAEQASRYADLVAARTGTRPDPAIALAVPDALRTSAPPTTAGRDTVFVPASRLRAYAGQVGHVLGMDHRAVETHRSWPQLAALLAVVDRAGHDPAALLTASAPAAGGELTSLARTARRLARQHGVDSARMPQLTALWPSDVLTRVLGSDRADLARGQAAWPALRAALRRAEAAGFDPAELLRSADAARLWPERWIAQALADAVRHRQNRSAPPATPDAWRTLAWTLAARERAGAENLLPPGTDRITVEELLAQLQVPAADPSAPAAMRVPPWTPPTPAGGAEQRSSADHAMRQHLSDVHELIATRVASLVDNAITSSPAWVAALGTAPAAAPARASWREALGVVAAYRDQQQIGDDDPRHPLGPYVAPDRAGHTAYWTAAAAIVNARREAAAALSLRPRTATAHGHIGPSHQTAVDTYLGLPAAERACVATRMVAQLGTLWHGADDDLDTGVTQPIYAAHLHGALSQYGHLARRVDTAEGRPATRQNAPGNAAAGNSRRPVRSEQGSRSRRPAAEPRLRPVPLAEPPRPQQAPGQVPRLRP